MICAKRSCTFYFLYFFNFIITNIQINGKLSYDNLLNGIKSNQTSDNYNIDYNLNAKSDAFVKKFKTSYAPFPNVKYYPKSQSSNSGRFYSTGNFQRPNEYSQNTYQNDYANMYPFTRHLKLHPPRCGNCRSQSCSYAQPCESQCGCNKNFQPFLPLPPPLPPPCLCPPKICPPLICPPVPICPPLPPPCPQPLPCPPPLPPPPCQCPLLPPAPPLIPPPSPCFPRWPLSQSLIPQNDCCCRCQKPCRNLRDRRYSPSTLYNAIKDEFDKNYEQFSDAKCNSNKLKQIIEENITDDLEETKQRVQISAENIMNEPFNTICGKAEFSYIIRTKLYCQASSKETTCYVFSHL